MSDRWLPDLPANLLLGTSSFSWPDWNGVFYPAGLPAAERLGYYARHFPAVEVDTTFYRMPTRSMLGNWVRCTPDTFRIALKVPQEITHEAQLADCRPATAEFLDLTASLGPRRGPLVLQFPYVAKGADADEYRTGDRFHERLSAWLDDWSGAADWVVEIRNQTWLGRRLFALLREHGVPLALTAYTTMPSLARMQRDEVDPLTGPFAYVRFLGDRKSIDRTIDRLLEAGAKTARFDALVEDKEPELRSWVGALLPVITRMRTWAFFNNHYAGFGPGSAQQFARLWREIHGLD